MYSYTFILLNNLPDTLSRPGSVAAHSTVCAPLAAVRVASQRMGVAIR